MPISTKVWKTLGGGLVVALFAFVVVRSWVVPALIVRAIQGQFEGRATIRDWWLNGQSAGVIGLAVHEQSSADSALFASVERVSTDLSLWRLLRGHFFPARIVLQRPAITLRVDDAGQFLNLPGLKGIEGQALRLPTISVKDARVVFHRAGTPDVDDMVVSGVAAQLEPDASGRVLALTGRTHDPTWGQWTASGAIAPGDRCGDVLLKGARVEADPKMLARVPFIPSEIWTHVVPRGPVNLEVRLDWTTDRTPELQVNTEVTLLGTSARFPTLELAAAQTTGRLRVDGALVRVDRVQGQTLGGQVDGGGTLDFGRSPPQIHLNLELRKIKVEETPKLWQLDQSGITGLLTGKVALHAVLNPSGIDLSGSTGEANVEHASIRGIPVKLLRLAMRAHGTELEYDTKAPGETRVERLFRGLSASLFTRPALGLKSIGGALVAQGLVAVQAPTDPEKPASPTEEPRKFAVQLPKTISTEIELEDVDVAELIAKAQFVTAFPFPIPITGKLSLKAKATLPLGQLSDIKQYLFHGDVTLKEASVFKVDFTLLTARLALENGILDLKELRGVLVARPDGGPDNPPRESAPLVPAQGPLPPGGFRGNLRAEIAPPGGFSARFEGNQLPLCELSAPFFPRPTPLGGLASMNVEAKSDLAKAGDPAAWTALGNAESVQIRYRGATLDRVALQFQLKEGRLDLPSLTAQMAGHPLTVKGELDLRPPLKYQATLNVEDWDLASIASWVPNAPQPSPVTGTLSAQAEAEGTMSPWTITTDGKGRIGHFQAGPVPLGDVPFRWMTDHAAVLISDVEARPFGGRLSAEATIPVAGGGAAEGNLTFREIDTAQLSASIPGQGLKLTGRAEGSVAFVVPANAKSIEAKVRIASPDLTFQGIPAEQVHASIRTDQGVLKYEVTADSLGGKLKALGEVPLSSAPPPPLGQASDGEFRFVGFSLDRIWKAFQITGSPALLSGQGAIDANLRGVLEGVAKGVWLHGFLDLDDLKWDRKEPVGRLRGVVAKTPTTWRVEPLNGELMGGLASGLFWGTTPAQGNPEVGFNLRIERAALKRMLVVAPMLAGQISGLGTLQCSGRFDQELRANVGLTVDQAQFAGLPIREFQAPVVVVFSPASGAGTVQIRPSFARVAGGQVRGDGSFRVGTDRSFQGQVQLTGVDLHTLNRLGSDSNRLATGRISGQISLSGTDLNLPERYRGKVNLDLDDAALFSIPVFREVERFLGSARGGLFEDGDLVGTIANRQLIIESFALEGRLVQLHITGTVGFDTQLNLEVLVNTNKIIPETGLVLVSRIPGLSNVLGRSEQAIARIGSYLSNRLLKLRVTGTLKNPSVAVDASILVAETAVTFFAGVLKLPLGVLR
ncbi:translocation and assembly module TamB [Singulisphaera sp. GP187]|uniref:AsmA-like C-terminal region-containing protein n=1 Tax=Singulisphaera sp. GP187 TaxID=1882752 RepID=UPI0009262C34|nr:AsmA-like C-terminal region-containing protein [Singulisphaera sp. GP187]SIO66682.1 translocation and assembly module TamB [Singulisphaera sp. GP187]